jgi:hypothetical protein
MGRTKYTDAFIAQVMASLIAAGYPGKRGALQSVAHANGVPYQTVARWFNKQANPIPDELVVDAVDDLSAAIKRELDGVLVAMGERRSEASYRDLTIAAGILVDKAQLLDGHATERIDSRSISVVVDR